MKQGLVLIADAHLSMLQGLHDLLESLFETTLMVADELSLLETADQCHPEMIVVDLSLPVALGDNVISLLRKHLPETPLIAISVHDEGSVASSTLGQGARAYVLKRTAAVDLAAAAEAVRRGETYISPSIRFSPSAPHWNLSGDTRSDSGDRPRDVGASDSTPKEVR